MAADDDDFDDFDDYSLDALDPNELLRLEEQAVRETQTLRNTQQPAISALRAQPVAGAKTYQQPQRQQFQPPHPQNSQYQRPNNYLSYTQQQRQQKQASQNQCRTAAQHQYQTYENTYYEEPTLPAATHQHTAGNRLVAVNNRAPPEKPSSDYGEFEEFEEAAELWDTAGPTTLPTLQDGNYVAPGESTGGQNAQMVDFGDYDVDMGDEMAGEPVDLVDYPQNGVPHALEGQDVVPAHELKLMSEQFQIEKQMIADELQKAKAAELAKSGEVSVVRSNLQKATREHERIVASLKSHQAEETEKHRKEVENMKDSMMRMGTEMTFLKKELEEIMRHNRNLQTKAKILEQKRETPAPVSGGPDVGGMDIQSIPMRAMTPKKKGRSFAHRDGFDDDEIIMISPSKRAISKTPTRAGSKRKRSSNDSPILQLPLSRPRSQPPEPERLTIIDDRTIDALFAQRQDDRVEFFEEIMVHRYPETGERTFDALTKFSFPSFPKTTLSGFFFDKLTALKSAAPSTAFLVGVCRVLLGIWKRCLSEEFFGALSLILDLVRFSIIWSQGSFCFDVMDEAVDLIQQTVDLNAISVLRKEFDKVNPAVDIVACLIILEDIALSVCSEERQIRRFWKLIRSDFPLVLLNLGQPIAPMTHLTRLLSTSVFPDSFGSSTSDPEIQRGNEHNLLEATSRLLIDPLRSTPPPSPTAVLQLRTEILTFFTAISCTLRGRETLTKHPHALGRICKRLAEEIDELYEWRLPHHKAGVGFVNAAVRLLKEADSSVYDVRHLVAMTRLAFSDGVAQECGVEEETTDKAYRILEEMLTMDEADELSRLFSPSLG